MCFQESASQEGPPLLELVASDSLETRDHTAARHPGLRGKGGGWGSQVSSPWDLHGALSPPVFPSREAPEEQGEGAAASSSQSPFSRLQSCRPLASFCDSEWREGWSLPLAAACSPVLFLLLPAPHIPTHRQRFCLDADRTAWAASLTPEQFI